MRDAAVTRPATIREVDEQMARILGSGPVADAARLHLGSGGARIRARIALDAATKLGLDAQEALSCAVCAELLHNASLIHDDIQDGDRTRRGDEALWVRFGTATALSAGDLMISGANAALAGHPHPSQALLLTHTAIAATIRGQAEDLSAQDAYTTRLRIAAEKSGPLLALPLKLALSAAQSDGLSTADFAARDLAQAYQALDDMADRDDDLAHGSANLCLSLEREGISQAEAVSRLRETARRAIRDAHVHISHLPAATRSSFSGLADRMDRQLKDSSDAA